MILPLENQVCSLESAKQLKELGFKQESLFYWVIGLYEEKYKLVPRDKVNDATYYPEVISAYTVAELGELLPQYVEVKVGIFYLRCEKENIYWKCGYAKFDSKDFLFGEQDLKESECRAKMLIYLKENKLI